jgi:hypothetical protein
MSTNEKARNRKKIGAIALVAIGIAGLGAASASQLTVNSRDAVASGTSTPVIGLQNATATVKTVPAGTAAPDATGAVPVSLSIAVDQGTGMSGLVYVNGGTAVPFTTATTVGAAVIVPVSGITSLTPLTSVAVVIQS